jgi:hypothetical protein
MQAVSATLYKGWTYSVQNCYVIHSNNVKHTAQKYRNTQMRKSGVYDTDINDLRRDTLEVTNIHSTSDQTTELMLTILYTVTAKISVLPSSFCRTIVYF